MNHLPSLHLVAGFLGSGKTTAIIHAAKALARENQRVGVVTNDQGKYLVDTAFFRLSDLPTVEVGGGCFCCNFVDLEKQLDVLIDTAKPDVIFAESVGSCGDLVATVVKPLKELHSALAVPTSFSVFTDARLLRMRLLDIPLPFSDEVVYIFDQQIAESELVVVNKMDLFKNGQADQVLSLSKSRWTDKHFLPQVSLTEDGVSPWLDLIQSGQAAAPDTSLDMDYARYGQGEQQLAWLDEKILIRSPKLSIREGTIHLIAAIIDALRSEKLPIGHVKFILTAGEGGESKVSFTSLEQPDWAESIPSLAGQSLSLLINARVECPVRQLQELVHAAIAAAADQNQLEYEIRDSQAFHPAEPRPTYRIYP